MLATGTFYPESLQPEHRAVFGLSISALQPPPSGRMQHKARPQTLELPPDIMMKFPSAAKSDSESAHNPNVPLVIALDGVALVAPHLLSLGTHGSNRRAWG